MESAVNGLPAASKNRTRVPNRLLSLIKIGDGSALKFPARAKATTSGPTNGRVMQTCAVAQAASGRGDGPATTVPMLPTRSLFDRAHEQRDWQGNLVPSARKIGRTVLLTVQQSKPRRYPAYYMTDPVRGISFEESCDQLHEAQRRLNGVPGIGLRDTQTAAETANSYLTRLKSCVGAEAARDMTRRRAC